ncbi:hypothetical protein WR25_13030 [Diploscapter pachys]|uniref:SXP/RAL-2 family protein Ani s 5-like cation-binding domain-containing protein n=1 Tax=Diploscapter pachys TaxID=2018661 RepID=A0A2A2JUM0_9BILA|nr:hypothetical protein WR25_13030 [Diploscapter pachys]
MKSIVCIFFYAICTSFISAQSSAGPTDLLPSTQAGSSPTGPSSGTTQPANNSITALKEIIEELKKLLKAIADGTLTSVVEILVSLGKLLIKAPTNDVRTALAGLINSVAQKILTDPVDVLKGKVPTGVTDQFQQTISKLEEILQQLQSGSTSQPLVTFPSITGLPTLPTFKF